MMLMLIRLWSEVSGPLTTLIGEVIEAFSSVCSSVSRLKWVYSVGRDLVNFLSNSAPSPLAGKYTSNQSLAIILGTCVNVTFRVCLEPLSSEARIWLCSLWPAPSIHPSIYPWWCWWYNQWGIWTFLYLCSIWPAPSIHGNVDGDVDDIINGGFALFYNFKAYDPRHPSMMMLII